MHRRRSLRIFAFAVGMAIFGNCWSAGAAPPEIPKPSVQRIDYANPMKSLVLNESLGDQQQIASVAKTLRRSTPEDTLAAIGRWINANLKYDPTRSDSFWEGYTFDVALKERVYGGCASHALVFAALARGCDIPTVFVKSMDADWIREFQATGVGGNWRGHVFLEVYIRGQWRLFNATEGWLFDQYDVRSRLLPGNRYAYDKGVDPKELILSIDWNRWLQQTKAYFSDFDVALLPAVTSDGRPLGRVLIAAEKEAVVNLIKERMKDLGLSPAEYPITWFNAQSSDYLRFAAGGELIITCVGSELALQQKDFERYLPMTFDELIDRLTNNDHGIRRKVLDDGTRISFIFGPDLPGIQEALKTFVPHEAASNPPKPN